VAAGNNNLGNVIRELPCYNMGGGLAIGFLINVSSWCVAIVLSSFFACLDVVLFFLLNFELHLRIQKLGKTFSSIILVLIFFWLELVQKHLAADYMLE
jgi:hypothetical protein